MHVTGDSSTRVGSSSWALTAARWRYAFDLVTHLVAREFRLRYRRALFGWLWALAVPLSRLLVLSFVFVRILPLGIPDYPVFLFSGLIAWSWFSSAVTSATSSAVDRKELFLRPGVPRAAVPVVSVLTDALDFVAALPVLIVFLMLSDGVPATALALPLVMALQFLLVLGLGFALCSLNVYLRDARLFVDVALLLGFYMTPVFYGADRVPAAYRWVVELNPVARLLVVYRNILIDGRLPHMGSVLALTTACVGIFALGYAIYRSASPAFVDEL